MGKFLLGLIIGVIVGVLAMAFNPNLPEQVRTAVASVSVLVLRGTEEAADAVGEAADEVGDEAREAGDGAADEPADQPVEPAPQGEPAPAQ